jgi:hypothetical protein
MNWSVSECIEVFEGLCHEAFTRRTGSSLPLIGFFVENYHHSRYETSSLERALQKAFTDDLYLFGGKRKLNSATPTKVAVTATSSTGKKTSVLANYNRPIVEQRSSKLSFPKKSSFSLLTMNRPVPLPKTGEDDA